MLTGIHLFVHADNITHPKIPNVSSAQQGKFNCNPVVWKCQHNAPASFVPASHDHLLFTYLRQPYNKALASANAFSIENYLTMYGKRAVVCKRRRRGAGPYRDRYVERVDKK